MKNTTSSNNQAASNNQTSSNNRDTSINRTGSSVRQASHSWKSTLSNPIVGLLITSVLILAVIFTAHHTSQKRAADTQSDTDINGAIASISSTGRVYTEEDIVTDNYGNIALDAEHFPDSAFRKYVAHFDTDNNGILSADERGKVFEINLHDEGILTSHEVWEVENLEGLQYFPSLVKLDCSGTGEITLDVSSLSNLEYLNCSMDGLYELDVTHNPNLKKLYCSVNHLSTIDLSNNRKLTHFYCISNDLTTLDVSNCPHLTELDFSQNELTSIDLESNHELRFLACVYNRLETMTMPRSTLLHYVDLTANENLAEVDVSHNPILIALLKHGPRKGENANTWECFDNGNMFLQASNTTEVYWAVG